MSSFPLTFTPSFFKMGTSHHQPDAQVTEATFITNSKGALGSQRLRRAGAGSATQRRWEKLAKDEI